MSIRAEEDLDTVRTGVPRALPPAGPPPDLQTVVIRPERGWRPVDVGELWRFRELLYFLCWRDVKVRYKQTALGAAWAILQPLMMMVVFTIFFGRLAGVSSGGLPYPLFALAGLLPWTFFATAVGNAGNSVVGSSHLITKVYFPRLAIPLASVGAAMVDFVVALGLLAALMIYYGVAPGPGLLLVPLIFATIAMAALGIGTLLAALNVKYRDFKYVIPFLMQIWMFATPSIYMDVSTLVASPSPSPTTRSPALVAKTGPETSASPTTASAPTAARPSPAAKPRGGEARLIRAVLTLNPMTGLIGGFRAAALGGPIPWASLGASTTFSALILLAGCLYFRKAEDGFSDVI